MGQLEEQFEKGFQETLIYKKSTGNPNAPQIIRQPKVSCLVFGKVIKGANTVKENYLQIGSSDLKKLGSLGGRYKEPFEKGFQETLSYKESTGNPNAPQSYKTPEGYRLGSWQDDQRQHTIKENYLQR